MPESPYWAQRTATLAKRCQTVSHATESPCAGFAYSGHARRRVLSVLLVLGTGCSSALNATPTAPPGEVTASQAATLARQRDADVPELPFPDNPDPNACGIPTVWNGETVQIEGTFQGQLVEPTVYLYDSHERLHIAGAVPSGTTARVELYQGNPVLDFYYVRADTPAGPQSGWVPAPFLRLAKH